MAEPTLARRWRSRTFALVVLASFGSALLGLGPPSATGSSGNLSRYVNPFAGTMRRTRNSGAGRTFPGPTMPFGMIQWSPDLNSRGYQYATPGGRHGRITGLSLTHLSGAGCRSYQDFPFIPTAKPPDGSPVARGNESLDSRYALDFNHAQERARPGLYEVRLDPGQPDSTDVKLTSSTRAAVGRFSYPRTHAATMMIDAGGSAMPDRRAAVHIHPGRREVSGAATSGYFCLQRPSYGVYFDAQFSHPFRTYGTWKRDRLERHSTASSDERSRAFPPRRAETGAYVTMDATHRPRITVRVGISFVSIANARHNLEAETAGRSFRSVRNRAHRAWNEKLGLIRVGGGSRPDRRTFYTDLYHAMIAPRTFSDANGQYPGMDGRVHSADGHVQYTDFSGWDVYRSEVPLLALLVPARAGDLVRSLLNDSDQSGCLPKWAFADGQTMEMIGDPADPAIASAAALGADRFDPSAAMAAMVRGATRRCRSPNGDYVERQGLAPYRSLGYIPFELNHQGGGTTAVTGSPNAVRGSAATTLEYETADFSIAQFAARALGDSPAYRTYMRRAARWTRSFDHRTGYIEPRRRDGGFPAHFNPTSKIGFVEGDGAQYRWMVPYDLGGLADRLGGSRPAAHKLDGLLEKPNDVRRRFHSRHALLGNEPTLLTPWIYDWFKEPFKTQRAVRQAVGRLYDPSPSGYPGNDDLGALSSWYLFGALGLYPAVPGTGLFALSSPVFPRAILHLPGGDVMIDSSGPTQNRPYVRRLRVNGHVYRKAWLPFCSIASGGRLNYRLSGTPRRAWGARGSDRPPSFSAGTPPPTGRCRF